MSPSGIPTPRALPTDHSRQGLDSKSLAREAVIRLDADPGVRACLKEAAPARSPAQPPDRMILDREVGRGSGPMPPANKA